MWNPFRKETFWESIFHGLQKSVLQRASVFLIMTLSIVVFISIMVIYRIGGKNSVPMATEGLKPHSVSAQLDIPIISGEGTETGLTQKEEWKPQAGEICIKHPDIFHFHISYADSTGSMAILSKQLDMFQLLAHKGAIVFLDQNSLKTNKQHLCFPGNPIGIVSILQDQYAESVKQLGDAHMIPISILRSGEELLDTTIGVNDLNIQDYEINQYKDAEFIREIIQQYLEIESGGLFKNL